MIISRRALLGAVASLAVLARSAPVALANTPEPPFSFRWLTGAAEKLAASDYAPPEKAASDWLQTLGYDAYREIRLKKNHALWHDKRLGFEAEFFHLGGLYQTPVALHEVVDGKVTPLVYDPAQFGFGPSSPPEGALQNVKDYAGFRLHANINSRDYMDEFLVFLGASYFRGVGKGQNYGLSARGLAINTALARGEEFPLFRSFWIERPARGAKTVIIHALLDSASVTGAYRFAVTPGAETRMEVKSRLFVRKDIERLGIAPLTSMFEFGENDRRIDHDFRPEVHDSDGLLLCNGTGEWIWRPLLNPAELGVSSYGLENPRGFGLLQRDRLFANYEDIEAKYEIRPSLWVEPKGDWGRGVMQLVEIPTDSEIHDNIAAYWIPEAPVTAGQKLSFDYALSWGDGPSGTPHPAKVLSTRTGRQFDHHKTKFVIDFEGRSGGYRRGDAPPQVDLWTSRGGIHGTAIIHNPHTGGWRVAFDLLPDGESVHELRCSLRRNNRPVSETWSFQWRPE